MAGPGRLTKRADFVAARRGRRFDTPLFTLQSLTRRASAEVEAQPRLGFTVTKKIGGAVERNRIRRRLREAARRAALAWRPGNDYVLIARREALSADFACIEADLARAVAGIHAPRAARGRGPEQRIVSGDAPSARPPFEPSP